MMTEREKIEVLMRTIGDFFPGEATLVYTSEDGDLKLLTNLCCLGHAHMMLLEAMTTKMDGGVEIDVSKVRHS